MADSDVTEVEAEATPNTEAGAVVTAKTPAVTAKPQEGEAVKDVAKTSETKVEKKAEAKPKAVKAEADKPAEPEKPKTPESYTFKDEGGKAIEGPAIKAFAEIAKTNGWTQEDAEQRLGSLTQGLRDSHQAQVAKWRADAVADKEIGGEKLAENLSLARKAMQAVGIGDDYLKFLDDSGLGNRAETIKAWVRVWKAVGPDGFTPGVRAPGRPGDRISNPNDTSVAALAKALYGDAKQ